MVVRAGVAFLTLSIALLAVPAIGLAMPFAAIYAGMRAAHGSKRSWVGWAVGALVFLGMGAGMASIERQIRAADCRQATDFCDCVEGRD
jgi:hypothetical protein